MQISLTVLRKPGTQLFFYKLDSKSMQGDSVRGVFQSKSGTGREVPRINMERIRYFLISRLPTGPGMAGNKKVVVFGGTTCTGVVVCRRLVLEEQLSRKRLRWL